MKSASEFIQWVVFIVCGIVFVFFPLVVSTSCFVLTRNRQVQHRPTQSPAFWIKINQKSFWKKKKVNYEEIWPKLIQELYLTMHRNNEAMKRDCLGVFYSLLREQSSKRYYRHWDGTGWFVSVYDRNKKVTRL